jgi:hypothetical protein
MFGSVRAIRVAWCKAGWTICTACSRIAKAVFALRGGYGAAQLLDRIDYDLICSNPKILLGYSDITALHLAIHKKKLA